MAAEQGGGVFTPCATSLSYVLTRAGTGGEHSRVVGQGAPRRALVLLLRERLLRGDLYRHVERTEPDRRPRRRVVGGARVLEEGAGDGARWDAGGATPSPALHALYLPSPINAERNESTRRDYRQAERAGSSVSDPAWAYGANTKKGKAPAAGKGKEAAAACFTKVGTKSLRFHMISFYLRKLCLALLLCWSL